MADLNVKTKVIGDLTVSLSKEKGGAASAFDRLVAGLKFLGKAITDPSYGNDIIGRPDQGLPGEQPEAGQDLPSGARPDNTVPGAPTAGQELPGQANRPSQGLPGEQPEAGQELPGAPATPGNAVPGAPGIDNAVPGQKIGQFLQNNAEEIARAILKGTACDPAAAPKK